MRPEQARQILKLTRGNRSIDAWESYGRSKLQKLLKTIRDDYSVHVSVSLLGTTEQLARQIYMLTNLAEHLSKVERKLETPEDCSKILCLLIDGEEIFDADYLTEEQLSFMDQEASEATGVNCYWVKYRFQ